MCVVIARYRYIMKRYNPHLFKKLGSLIACSDDERQATFEVSVTNGHSDTDTNHAAPDTCTNSSHRDPKYNDRSDAGLKDPSVGLVEGENEESVHH
jgi:hypothetical protein